MAQHDLIIIGAGPGGYVAAIRAAQLGFNVASVEMEEQLGGTCVRVGCIPSKALLESSEKYAELLDDKSLGKHGLKVKKVELDLQAMLAQKDAVVKANTDGVNFLYRKNKIERYRGRGELLGSGKVAVHSQDGERTELQARHIIIATGSSVATLPGVELDGERIISSTEALSLQEVPEHLVVIGAGYIGLELGSVWARLGARVTVLEYMDRILPGMDAELAREALKVFKRQGIEFRLGARVTGASSKDGGVVVELEEGEPIEASHVLMAVGRKPNTEGLGLDNVGVETDERGRVKVDDRYATNVEGVYAIGDVIEGPMLAHKAQEDGVALAEILAGHAGNVDYGLVPGIVYTEPEIATVGKSEEQLKEEGIPYKKGNFPFQAVGRARAMDRTDGKVKVLAHAETDRVLGVHIIGTRAGDLIAEAVAAMTFGASSEDIGRTIHAHPTLAEAVKEAALAVGGDPIHM